MPRVKSRPRKSKNEDSEDELSDDVSIRSICSSGSESLSLRLSDLDDETVYLKLKDKISTAVEDLTETRSETRVKALRVLTECFRLGYLSFDSDNWNYMETLARGLEFNLKKGQPKEKASAAGCLAVVAVQLDQQDLVEWLLIFRQSLETIINDVSASCAVRTSCCRALASLTWFSADDDHLAILQSIQILEKVCKTACLKGDGRSPVHEQPLIDLQEAALDAWLLLFSSLPCQVGCEAGINLLPSLVSMLQNVHVDIRIAAARASAIIFERVRFEKDASYRGPHYTPLRQNLDDLLNDSSKGKSKNDKKKQRTSLRAVFTSLIQHNSPETKIKFGQENLFLCSCMDHFYYDTLCNLLTIGINRHLAENLFIRQLFDLGPPLKRGKMTHAEQKTSKAQRHYENQFAFKMRTQNRNSHRENKAEFLGQEQD